MTGVDPADEAALERVVNSAFDRLLVHTPRSPRPIPIIVRHQDRDAVMALLVRACSGLGGKVAGWTPSINPRH
ncbi:MAG: hypothetical protein HYY06_30275 [Deltaproteobacteria bacterium]|nr:hypothetical protein [Deltaproteobacteria bacterium]